MPEIIKIEEHWLISTIADDLLIVKNFVIKKKLEERFQREFTYSPEQLEMMNKVLNVLELASIDLIRRIENKEENITELFAQVCAEYFTIAQNRPAPSDPINKIKFILKLISFSYLGEKWEDGRRFLIEKEAIWKFDFEVEEKDWDLLLLKKSYLAIIYLVRKNNWSDLSNALEIIGTLRNEQNKFEENYFNSINLEFKRGAAYEVASFYHLAKSIELLAKFNLEGTPTSNKLLETLNFHLEKGMSYCQLSGNLEFELVLNLMKGMFRKMIFNSIWRISEKINSRVTKFVRNVTSLDRPIFELMYPQRVSILEQGLLDPAHRAIVVNLPTSSGKTLIAEFRILQALNQFSDEKGWIAYVAPTRALVNQITLRLKKDLAPIGVGVEKMSGALELDAFEDNLIKQQNGFDILVTTPEKLHLLIRQNIEEKLNRKLVLVVADEIQNMESGERGLNLEMMLATIQNDCAKANFLLLTPFVPNGEEIAKWLDPTNPKSISIELDWKPNDKVVGLFYPEGKARDWKTYYRPLVTTQETIVLDEKILIGQNENNCYPYPVSQLRTRYVLTSVIASQLVKTGNNLVIAGTVDICWDMAKLIYDFLPALEREDERVSLVKKFIAAELGDDFPLIHYLSKGIGIHNSGLPEEVKSLMEWLMEEGLLRVLVATTTIAHGINFPVSSIFMASYSYPYKLMPSRDFWNLAGRAGRMDQNSLGVIGIAVSREFGEDVNKVVNFVQEKTKNLVSVLQKMVEDLIALGEGIKLETLSYYPEWSSFLQYIAHMYKQADNIEKFISESEITLRRTYGFSLLDTKQKGILLEAVNTYAKKLDSRPELATLSDATGFSPETVGITMAKVRELDIKQDDWNSSRLFSNQSDSLKNLLGIMLGIPEIKDSLKGIFKGESQDRNTLAGVINDWISGKEITQIAKDFWEGDNPTNLSRCVSALYSKIANSATWGLASILKLPGTGIDYEKISEEDARRLKNIPAMIYYGVNTDEGILMRTNSVPRTISKELGKIFKDKQDDIYSASSSDVNEWLKNLDERTWDSVVPSGKTISGKDYKDVWKKLSGIT